MSALLLLLLCCAGGYGVPVNQTLAIELFDLATERGSWRAAQQLMMVHESGFGGVPVNLTRAVEVGSCAWMDCWLAGWVAVRVLQGKWM